MHCTLPRSPSALGQRRHHLQAVAEDHAVGPVGVVAVELGAGVVVRQAVEVGEQIELLGRRLPSLLAAPDQGPSISTFGWTFSWMKQGRGLHNEVGPVLLVLAPPQEAADQGRGCAAGTPSGWGSVRPSPSPTGIPPWECSCGTPRRG